MKPYFEEPKLNVLLFTKENILLVSGNPDDDDTVDNRLPKG